jgi:hypothetical protein
MAAFVAVWGRLTRACSPRHCTRAGESCEETQQDQQQPAKSLVRNVRGVHAHNWLSLCNLRRAPLRAYMVTVRWYIYM